MSLEVQKIWKTVLVNISMNISKANYNTWFKDMELKEIKDDGTAVIIVPSEFVKKWILEKFNTLILKFLINATDEVKKIEYIVDSSGKLRAKKNTGKKKKTEEKEVTGKLNLTFTPSHDSNLNPKYHFGNFVVGSFNEVAYAASQAVVKRKEVVYNPLFIYGGTGHGKTHLIQAVGNQLKKNNPDKKVFYITSEKFYMDVIDFIGLKSNKTNNFKKKYREYDVFIMDDIQFLTKKERTQEELFHLFNYLYDNNKQIILSSDVHPNQISDLEERLKSRFNAGMIVDIQSPDYESRLEILKKKAEINNLSISLEVLDYVATHVTGNIRELEGILNIIFIQTEIRKKELSLNEVKEIIQSNYKSKKPSDYKKLIEIVANHFNVDKDCIYQKTRKKEYVIPRQIIMFLMREDFKLSYPTIGEKLGGRDHTTVMHSCERVKKALSEDMDMVKDLEIIRRMYK